MDIRARVKIPEMVADAPQADNFLLIFGEDDELGPDWSLRRRLC